MSKMIVLTEEKLREAISVAVVDASAVCVPSDRVNVFMDMIREQAMKYGHIVEDDSIEGLQVRTILIGT
jgi:hypothetical protein